MAAALGTLCKYGFGSTSTVDKFLEVISESVQLRRGIRYNGGMVGTRSQPSERTREGPRMVSGSISCTPSPIELDGLLPLILGGAESADVFPLAETLPPWYFTADRDEKVCTYGEMAVNAGSFSANAGGFLELNLDVMGQDETVANAGTFPAIALDIVSKPYVSEDGALTIGGTTTAYASVSLSVNNMLESQTFNSLTPARFNATGREINWNISIPYGDYTALYGPAVAGVAVVWTLTQGARSIIFSSNKVQFDKVSPSPSGRGEIFMQLSGTARKDGSTLELVTTADSTG